MDENKYRKLCDQLEDEECRLSMYREMLDESVLLSDGIRNVQLTDNEKEIILYTLIDKSIYKINLIKKKLNESE